MAGRVAARGTRRAEDRAGSLGRLWNWYSRGRRAEPAARAAREVDDALADAYPRKLQREGFDAPPTDESVSGGRRWNNDLSR